MRFPRNARILRSQLDVAPFAAVFFLLAIFLILGALVPTPGLPLRLTEAHDLPGLAQPAIAVAVDASGRYFYANQLMSEAQLRAALSERVRHSSEPPGLIVQADQAVPTSRLIRLALLAREAGIRNAELATLERPFNA